jgi:hypothetical protein
MHSLDADNISLYVCIAYVTHWQKKYPWHFLTSLSLYVFTIWKCIAYNFFCRDGIYFDKILVSEYRLFKRSNNISLYVCIAISHYAMQGPVAIILISWNVIFIWETGYWTRAIKRFALFDLLKSLYSDTKILSKYIPSLQKKFACTKYRSAYVVTCASSSSSVSSAASASNVDVCV